MWPHLFFLQRRFLCCRPYANRLWSCQLHSSNMKCQRKVYIQSFIGSESRKIATYVRICGNIRKYGMQPYLHSFANLKQRRILSLFRSGSHWLRVQTGRHKREQYADRICEQCNGHTVEDEEHFLFQCPHYECMRMKYADLFDVAAQSLHAFFQQNDITIAKFLTECKNMRK